MIKRFCKFCIVGGIGTIINLIIFAILTTKGINYLTSAIISFIVAVTSNYTLNQLWVFSDRHKTHSKKLWLKFMFVSIFSLGINILTLFIMERFIMPSLIKYNWIKWIINTTYTIIKTKPTNTTAIYSQCFGIATSMIFNFVGNNCFTFKNSNIQK